MKTTLEINDVLYREVVALSRMTGRTIEDLIAEGLRHVLSSPQENGRGPGEASGLAELRQWFKAADRAMKKALPGRGVREILEADRRRLETP